MRIKKSKKYYKNKFDELFNSGTPIIDQVTGEELILQEGETFRQCYADTPKRNTFPKQWFVSKQGNLISVVGNKLIWVHKIPREKGSQYTYKYCLHTGEERVTKNVQLHNLVGLVFGSESFGKATELLNDKGVYAFGVCNPKEDVVQGHHIDGDPTNSNPNNIKFLTDKTHTLFNSGPGIEATEEKQFRFMQRFGKLMETENPDTITVYFPGQTYNKKRDKWESDKSNDIHSTRKILVTQNFIRDLQSMINFITEDLKKENQENE